MEFQEGNTYGQGRPPGSRNKLSSELREKYGEFLEKDFEQFEKDYKSLTPFQRMKVRADLWGFYFPKLKSLEVDTNVNMSEEMADQLLTELKKEYVYKLFENRLTGNPEEDK